MIRSLALFIVLIGCAARLVLLDADPKLPDWIGYVTDEGRWVETARNLALFGELRLYGLSQMHLLLSPGFQAVVFVVFKLFGVSFWSARLFTELCGCGLLLAVYGACRREVNGFAMLLGMSVLAFEPLMLRVSRLALPELPAALFMCLALLVLVFAQRMRWAALLAGALAATAVAMKATTVLVVPAFLLIALVTVPQASLRERVQRLGMFLAGFTAPAIAGGILAAAAGMLDAHLLLALGPHLEAFLGLAAPFQVLSRYVSNSSMATVYVLLAGAWFASWIWYFHREFRDTVLGQLYLASGIWALWWLLVWSSIAYFPDRYLVQVIVPLTLHVMAGLTLAARIGLPRTVAAMGHDESPFALARTASWLAAPTAVTLAPLLVAAVRWTSVDFDRASVRAALVVITGIALALVIRRYLKSAPVVRSLLYLPVIFSLLWIGAAALGVTGDFWPAAPYDATAKSIVLSVAAVAGAAILARADLLAANRAIATLTAGVLIGAFAWTVAPDFAQPTYSIRDASRTLAKRFDRRAVIWSRKAGALLLETPLRYQDDMPVSRPPDGILVFDHDGVIDTSDPAVAGTSYVRIAQFELAINPRYDALTLGAIGRTRGARIIAFEPAGGAHSERSGSTRPLDDPRPSTAPKDMHK